MVQTSPQKQTITTAVTPFKPRLISVAEYHHMAEVGILQPDEKLELINGQIIEHMVPQRSFHAAAVNRTNRLFFGYSLPNALVRSQLPITLNNFSEPEPDIAIVKLDPSDYDDHHPTAADIYLIIEVADSTLKTDLEIKSLLYAQNGISDYWVLDLNHRQLQVFREPTEQGYQQQFILEDDASIQPLTFSQITIPIAKMLRPKIDEP
jgi:Uma2 family endonuclease